MAVTVAQLVSEILRNALFGRIVALAGLDGTTETGSNLGVRSGLRSALRDAGIVTADPLTLSDADVSAIGGSTIEFILMRTRVNIINDVLMNWDNVEKNFGADLEACKRMEERLRKLRAEFESQADALKPSTVGGGPAGVVVGAFVKGSVPPKCPPRTDRYW